MRSRRLVLAVLALSALSFLAIFGLRGLPFVGRGHGQFSGRHASEGSGQPPPLPPTGIPEPVHPPAAALITPLHRACYEWDMESVKKLLDEEVPVDVRAFGGEQPLHCAAAVGWMAGVNLLLEKGADVNAVDRDGRTPLHWAVDSAQKEMVIALLGRGRQ
jgi:ankyrin repeat protein